MEDVKIEPPKILNNRTLIYWAEKEGYILGNMKHKALKFLEYNCIREVENGWDILPIENYNVTTHKIRNGKCTCQYNTKYDKECSHLIAVRLWDFKEKWNERT